MTTILTLLFALSIAYGIKYFLMRFSKRLYLTTTGPEYVVLGLVLGPAVLGVFQEDVVEALSPAMTIVIGSIGFLAGLRVNFRKIFKDLESNQAWASFWIVATTVVLMGAAALWGLSWLSPVDSVASLWPLMPLALLIVSTAVVSATTPVQFVVQQYKAKGWTSRCVLFVAEFSEVVGIIIFGFLFAIYHPPVSLLNYQMGSSDWVLLELALGPVFGFLFSLFIGNQEKSDKLLVAVLGIIVFSSGIAYYLAISPLMLTFLMGATLTNLSRYGERLRDQLEQIEKPFFIIVCFLAGVAWIPWNLAWKPFFLMIALIGGYILLRWGSKWIGGELAVWSASGEEAMPQVKGMGTGLLGQGGLSVAMVLSYLQMHRGDHGAGAEIYSLVYEEVYQTALQWPGHGIVMGEYSLDSLITTMLLASITLHEFVAVRTTRDLLINAGEIEPSVTLDEDAMEKIIEAQEATEGHAHDDHHEG